MRANDSRVVIWPGKPSDRFQSLWVQVGGSADFATHVFDLLDVLYGEPVRHYHRFGHIAHCLQELDGMAGGDGSRTALEMALWFHDAVYVPGAADNEQRSAQLFASHADALPADFVRAVTRLILVTTHKSVPDGADEAAMVDIDLSAFGVRWDDFIRDSRDVRAELAHLPDAQYYVAQTKFLTSLLARPRLYHTAHFFERYETQARDNIRRLLDHIGQHGHL
jgi:predicted metal-dependent HD superfamily phosphohydrolase